MYIYWHRFLISWKHRKRACGVCGWGGGADDVADCVVWGWNFFKELLRDKLSLTWGWAEVELRFCPWLLLFNYRTGGPEVISSLCLMCICRAGQRMRGPFFLPIAIGHLGWDPQIRMRLHKETRSKVSLRSQLQVKYSYTIWLKIRQWWQSDRNITEVKLLVPDWWI